MASEPKKFEAGSLRLSPEETAKVLSELEKRRRYGKRCENALLIAMCAVVGAEGGGIVSLRNGNPHSLITPEDEEAMAAGIARALLAAEDRGVTLDEKDIETLMRDYSAGLAKAVKEAHIKSGQVGFTVDRTALKTLISDYSEAINRSIDTAKKNGVAIDFSTLDALIKEHSAGAEQAVTEKQTAHDAYDKANSTLGRDVAAGSGIGLVLGLALVGLISKLQGKHAAKQDARRNATPEARRGT